MKKVLKLFAISLILSIVNGYIFLILNNNIFQLKNNKIQNLSKSDLNFLALVVAPILETLIFQFLLYIIFSNILKIKKEVIIIILMSAAFAISHNYHWIYMCVTFVGGLLLNNFYIKTLKIKNEMHAILYTMIFHFLYNLYGYLFIM